MKKLLLIIFLGFIGTLALAQAPAGYYSNASGKTGTELRAALHEIIDDHTTVSYQQIWTSFWSTDNKGNNVVWDMYSDGANYSYSYEDGNDQCGEYDSEGDCYNREHSWPKSWFTGDEQTVPGRDLHHIFPTDGYVNFQRGSNPYGEVSNPTWTSQNGSKLGPCVTSGYTGTAFEPIDEYKGDFARAIMYMSVRYYTEDSDWNSSGMTNKSDIKDWAIDMLLGWNNNDPVSQKEIDRNNAVYEIQHNRNPFIDNPEYARMIWDPNWTPSVVANGDYVKVTSTSDLTDGDYLIVYENGSKAFNGGLTALDATGNNISVTISNDVIASSEATEAARFTITAKTGGFSIKSASGYYIGNTSDDNALKTSQNDTYTNTISISNGNADIVCSSSHLRYNAANDQNRFRYFKSSSYTNQQAIQLYKKTPTIYTITLATVTNGTIEASATEAQEGTTITLTATPNSGYVFGAWTVTDTLDNSIAVNNNQFTMPASNVTVSASFDYVGTPFAQRYYLVTSTDQLVAGRTYLIVNTTAGKALGTTQNDNNRAAAAVTIGNDTIGSIGNSVCQLTLKGSEGAWAFFDPNWGNKGGYLYAASSSKNHLKTQATNNANGQWSIAIANGTATVVAQGTNSRNNMRYNPNNDNPIFSCYDSTSTLAKVELFIRSENYDITHDTTLPTLLSFDYCTIHNGATLTVNGTATSNEANHLVIEEGGQFIHHNNGVQATFQKPIAGYIGDGGWYTIATPFVSSTPNGTMVSDAYDLYYYDEDAEKEWINYKPAHFNMVANTGYLYAHSPDITLHMTGTLNSGDYSPTVNLSYGNSTESIKGYNLLGNPTAHAITFTKNGSVSDGYYYLNNDASWTYSTNATVPAGRGFLVKANAVGQSVTLNPQGKSDRNEHEPFIAIGIDGEQAFVKLAEGISMPLLSFREHSSSIYFSHEGQPYIMLVRNGMDAIELHYRAPRHGAHTLHFDANGLGLGYLHLLDRITGADVDLLQTPDYRFESHGSDYPSRFQLVFNPEAMVSHEPFAYCTDGQIVVYGVNEPYEIQVYDITGRMVNHLVSGVYLVRLITADQVRIQKLIVH